MIDHDFPNHNSIITNQLRTLLDHKLVDDQGRVVEVFNQLGNIHLELLAESGGVGVMIRSGEPSLESIHNRSDRGETFTFGNDGLG